jgi:hypothetical protein
LAVLSFAAPSHAERKNAWTQDACLATDARGEAYARPCDDPPPGTHWCTDGSMLVCGGVSAGSDGKVTGFTTDGRTLNVSPPGRLPTTVHLDFECLNGQWCRPTPNGTIVTAKTTIDEACARALETRRDSGVQCEAPRAFSLDGATSQTDGMCTPDAVVHMPHLAYPEFTKEQRTWCQARKDEAEAGRKVAIEASRASREAQERRLTERAKAIIDKEMKRW